VAAHEQVEDGSDHAEMTVSCCERADGVTVSPTFDFS
jgi:hypothetical protein